MKIILYDYPITRDDTDYSLNIEVNLSREGIFGGQGPVRYICDEISILNKIKPYLILTEYEQTKVIELALKKVEGVC